MAGARIRQLDPSLEAAMIPYRYLAVIAIILASAVAWPAAQQAQSPQPSTSSQRALPTDSFLKPWKGDFDAMLKQRRVRVLAPYSRTFYFNELGRERGYSADLVRVVEKYLNTKLAAQLGKRPLTFMIIPTTRDKLLTGVAEGLGDIAVNVGVSEKRKELVDFIVAPDAPPLAEVVLTGPKSPAINSVDDLSGKTVHTRPSSVYHEDLVALNEQFKKAGKPLVNIVAVPDAVEDEDMMEIVVDDMVANMWAKVLPKVKVNKAAVLRKGGSAGWAIRKGSPLLEKAVMDAYVNAVQNTPKNLADRTARYSGRVRQLQNPTGSADYKRFQDTLALFEKYATRYKFDPLMLSAQGYQESQLNQEARSPVGAIGLMQVMPATGKELGVGDITVAESNVHAGTKYMDQLVSKELAGANLDEVNRTLFAFAAYNCGPGNMAKLRKAAEARGLDPNVWFNNVEVVTAEKIGIETTTYVRNIYKYYVAYKLMIAADAAQRKARESIKK
jgi:membrane-bound lytic murein transglycosylase MltF